MIKVRNLVGGVCIILCMVCCTAKEPDRAVPVVQWQERDVDEMSGHVVIADVDGDGINDLLQISEDGKAFLWFHCSADQQLDKHVILKRTPFSGDRIAGADVDTDGDMDIIASVNIAAIGQPKKYRVIWLENPRPTGDPTLPDSWKIRIIGNQDSYIKDIATGDFNRDGKPDVVIRAEQQTIIFLQDTPKLWDKAIVLSHARNEGMDVGDLDLDGDPDIVLNGFWFETPEDLAPQNFKQHVFDKKWFTPTDHSWRDNNAAVKIVDLNKDGLPDILISHSELPGYPISYYSAASIQAVKQDEWKETRLAKQFDFCQTLDAGDIDNDGDIDVLAAKFERDKSSKKYINAPPFPVVVFYNVDGRGKKWAQQLLSEEGIYAGILGDLGGDGDLDIVGSRSYWRGPVRLWENKTADHKLALDKFSYIRIDDDRSERFFGLALGDLNGDGWQDIAAGKWFYRNPGGTMNAKWKRTAFPQILDAVLIANVDDDEFGDVIALKCNQQYWLESRDRQGRTWGAVPIGSLPICDHRIGTQYYGLGQIVPGGKAEIILEKYYLKIPDHPGDGAWPAVRYSSDGQGYAVGDVDGDGFSDIAGSYKLAGEDEIVPGTRDTKWWNSMVCWWRNPRDGRGDWRRFDIGPATQADRFQLADFNGDGRLDIAVSEERYPGSVENAHLYWYEQPHPGAATHWTRHQIAQQASMNSLDTADMDRDGDIDIITCEHRMPEPGSRQALPDTERLQIWENDGRGHFTEHLVDVGKESHLGAQTADLDADGDLDIVSIAWRNYKFLHLWRNDALTMSGTGLKIR